MKKFIGADREQRMLMPYDLEDWLPENHLARFVVDVVDKLDMRWIYNQYQGFGSTPYDPRMLLSLLFYGYSTGVFSSRKIESSTYDSVAFRFVAGNHTQTMTPSLSFANVSLARSRVGLKRYC